MPLLKKSFKGSLSQTKNVGSKHFKTPYLNHKDKIKELIDDPQVSNSTQNEEYDSFINNLHQKRRSSSPILDYNNIGNKENIPKTKSNENMKDRSLNRKHSSQTNEILRSKESQKDQLKTVGKSATGKKKNKEGDVKLSMSTNESFSQEELNEEKTKSAYVEFMKTSLAKEEKSKKLLKRRLSSSNFEPNLQKELNDETKDHERCVEKQIPKAEKKKQKKTNISLSTNESFSQDILNSDGVKAAYVQFMNKSLAKDTRKKNSFILYSSSEDLFNDVVESPSKSVGTKDSPKRLILYRSDDPLDKSIEKLLGKKIYNSSSIETASDVVVDKNMEDEIFKNTSNDKLVTGKKTRQNKKPKKEAKEKSSAKEKSWNKKPKTKKSKKKITNNNLFAHSTTEVNDCSDFPHLSVEEKMDRLSEARNVGLYVYCDSCDKARYLPDVVDPLDTPDKWYCYMNPDKKHNKCSDPEEVEEDEEFLVHNLYNAGSIVFARVQGYPWWPAMVEDDPDLEQYFWVEDSMEPTDYHVTFFDSGEVTRAWLERNNLAPFKKNLNNPEFQIPSRHKLKIRLSAAYRQAYKAMNMPLIDRLKMYGFLKRYKNPVKRLPKPKVNNRQKNARKEKERIERQSSTESVAASNISEILGNVNLQDLSFNFLD